MVSHFKRWSWEKSQEIWWHYSEVLTSCGTPRKFQNNLRSICKIVVPDSLYDFPWYVCTKVSFSGITGFTGQATAENQKEKENYKQFGRLVPLSPQSSSGNSQEDPQTEEWYQVEAKCSLIPVNRSSVQYLRRLVHKLLRLFRTRNVACSIVYWPG